MCFSFLRYTVEDDVCIGNINCRCIACIFYANRYATRTRDINKGFNRNAPKISYGYGRNDSRCITDVIGIVNAEDFYLEQNRQIYQAIYTMFNFSQTIDPVTVLDKMREAGVYHDNSLLRDVLDYTESDQFDVILMNPPYGGSEKQDVKNHFPSDLASSETADLFMAVIMYRLKKNGRAAVILPDGFLFGLDNAKVALKKKLLKEFNLHTVIRMPGSVFAPYTSITTNILFFDRTKATEETWFYRLDMPADRKHFSKTKPMKLEHFVPVVEWWNNRKEIAVEMSVTEHTVKKHTGNIFSKMDVTSRAELFALADEI